MSIFSNKNERYTEKRLKKVNKENKEKRLNSRKEYLLSKDTPFDVTESFRNLKASLSVSVAKTSDKGVAVMATSSFPEEGKTTVITNLALMFAQSDAKVVLVDADIRKGRVHKYFREHSTPGLSDYLSGQATLDEVLRQTDENENLYFLPCGTHSPRPYEILESGRMKELVEKLREKFDYVIFDTPPILVVPDALALAPFTDGTVLVCRHMTSYVSDIGKSLGTLAFAKVNVLGMIVNDFKMPNGKIYKGYKNYHHYYSYGYAPRPTTDDKK